MSQTADNPVRKRPAKSLGTALALAFFFGPIGLWYASVTGAVVMLVVAAVVLVPILLGLYMNIVLFFPVWIACIVWAAFAAHERSAARPEGGTRGGSERPAHAAGLDDGAPGRT